MISPHKVLSLIFGGFLVLIIAGILYFRFSEKNVFLQNGEAVDNVSSSSLQAENSAAAVEEKNNVQSFQRAISTQDESGCHKIDAVELRSECFDRVRLAAALEINELELCNSITNVQTKHYCQDNVIMRKAQSEKNVLLCRGISHPTLQAKCQKDIDAGVLYSAETPEDCQVIQDEAQRNSCTDELALSHMENFAAEEDCAVLLSAAAREKCHDYVWHELAVESKDPTKCLQISEMSERDSCEESMKVLLKTAQLSADMLQGKSTYCADFRDPELKKSCEDEANYYAAKIYKKTEYCQKISNESFQKRCNAELTAANDDYWLAKAQNEHRKDYCENISSRPGVEYCQALL